MITIKTPKDYQSISTFISKLNNIEEHHVGYCGQNEAEILHTLIHDFSDLPLEVSLVAAYDESKLVGVLGVDIDLNRKEAEVWGPFVDHKEWEELSKIMWDTLLEQLPISLCKVQGFYNLHNSQCQKFMSLINASRQEEHSILKISRNEFTAETNNIFEITDVYFEAFKTLHEQTFKGAYFSGVEILQKLDHQNKVFIATQSDKLLGYVYCEANPNFFEGDIHFIAVSPASRNLGIGRKLLNKTLEFLFSFEELKEITLCVNSSNQAAVTVYKNSGFFEVHTLVSYKLTL